MAEQISREIKNKPWWRDSTILWVGFLGAFAAGVTAAAVTIDANSDRDQRIREQQDYPRIIAGVQADGFSTTPDAIAYDDATRATLGLTIACRNGSALLVKTEVKLTRDGQGAITDVSNYTVEGLMDPYKARPLLSGPKLEGTEATLKFQNAEGLNNDFGGPGHDFCAAQSAVTTALATTSSR